MDKQSKIRSVTRNSPRSGNKTEDLETEKMDVCDASASFNGNTTSDINITRTNDPVILVLSDDEDFAGFPVSYNEHRSSSKAPKIKEEPLSDTEAPEFGGFDVKLEVKTEVIDEPHLNNSKHMHQSTPAPQQKRLQCDISDEKFKLPFKFGWKREVVYRSQMPDTRTKSDKAEVYYITPAPESKKLRTKNEIILHLSDGLDVNMFTFSKEPLGGGPDEEIVRSAKAYTPHTQRRTVPNFLDVSGEADPSLGFGKRIPKPKMPKGASPPPGNRNSTPAGSNSRKPSDAPADSDNKSAKTSKSSKLKGEPCTIQCVLAMGTIPTLQCKKCLCLFHPECVGIHNYHGSINHYICDNCKYEALAISQPEPASNVDSLRYTDKVPPESSVQPASVKKSLQSSQSTQNTTEKLIRKQPTNLHSEVAMSRSNDSKENKSVIGGLTTWLPPTANLISKRSQLDISVSPPQSIAIVAGRKYIMVPKTNLMSVSPDGNVKIGDNNGIPLDYVAEVERSNQNSNTELTTGEDSSPPTKKRKLSRSSSKVHSPVGSPTHSPGAQSLEASKNERNNIISFEAAAHKQFAASFMSNVSIGYEVLLRTFKYLKVQELARASCVCRMWNQIASNRLLWTTIRMKNSQVNDWPGLANTLKRNGTKHLDLRKMLIASDSEQTWQKFSSNIGKVNLETIDLCRCAANVVAGLFESNPGLRVLNAVAIKGEHLDVNRIYKLNQLRELRLRSLSTMTLNNFRSMEGLVHLTHLSLTSVNLSETENLHFIGKLVNLESMELGECRKLSIPFAASLVRLHKLEKIRLERGTDDCCTLEILDSLATLPKLTQLELVNFDIKPDFDHHLRRCRNIRRFLIIPTYISQSATTNNVILNGIIYLADHLEQLTWVVTLELLRVTELYVDQCDQSTRERRQCEDKIPVLKPVPGLSEEDQQNEQNRDVPQVEILSLKKVENILSKHLPKLRYSILKVPFAATWRQTMLEM